MAKVKIGMTRKNATDKLKKVRYLMDDVEIMQKRRALKTNLFNVRLHVSILLSRIRDTKKI